MLDTMMPTHNSVIKNLISIKDLKRDNLNHLMQLAHDAKQGKLLNTLKGKIIASCFFESSTRTRLSFEAATHRLGANVIGFTDKNNTSFGKKSETLTDTIQTLNGYADAIVMRHFEAGSAQVAANISTIPVVNAGDGANEHPSQTLLDLFTIKEKFGQIDGIKIAMIGDLRYGRTVHSLSYALLNYNDITIYYVAPKALQIPVEILTKLQSKNIFITCVETLADIISLVDLLYMTRLQKERFAQEDEHTMNYILTADILKQEARNDLIVMHPLPRAQEICNSVDATKYAWYFQQAKNGVFMRQAILFNLLT